MSELKAVHAYTLDEIEVVGSRSNGGEYYLKSEADKVIEEKDKYIDELQDKVTYLLLRDRNMALNFNNAVDAIVHNKYKRCLAMALFCFTKGKEKLSVYKLRTFFWSRWGNRRLKLAEKFKPNKEMK